MSIQDLPREQLLLLLEDFAKRWLAHDGLWFQAVERERGMAEAIHADTEAWRRFSPIEARRIKAFLGLGEHPGLEGLERALGYRLYAMLNTQRCERSPDRLRFFMDTCRVQSARRRKGLPDFPCRSVGEVEYAEFARAIDSRIATQCIACPPDPSPEEWTCGWEFWIEEGGGGEEVPPPSR